MYKLEKRIWDEFGEYISGIHCEDDGVNFGKRYGTRSWWVELKPGFITVSGEFTVVHESTLADCYRELKCGIRPETYYVEYADISDSGKLCRRREYAESLQKAEKIYEEKCKKHNLVRIAYPTDHGPCTVRKSW
ncbi:MAG: hypothetical protein IJS45_11520 [Clostridia bacterium]|nr:hypothetical protein [Clostridia bacterium]